LCLDDYFTTPSCHNRLKSLNSFSVSLLADKKPLESQLLTGTPALYSAQHGMGGTGTWRPASGNFDRPNGESLAKSWMRWGPFRNELMISHIAATSATTDHTRALFAQRAQRNDTESKGDNDGKRAV
jgi:hypothetical protein